MPAPTDSHPTLSRVELSGAGVRPTAELPSETYSPAPGQAAVPPTGSAPAEKYHVGRQGPAAPSEGYVSWQTYNP